ncbi:hypothetical protein [Alkaliphilus transvaalensis]|uniref:hypothetical protein n=1 Tax=Alkaliphilus transvaalensis TaxID=114628 RepID=UPI00047C5C51|nr:hypothetical protein [Alkaliphilus transvaalensis]
MFFSRKRKKLLDKKIIKKSNVPILIKDKEWREVFTKKSNRIIENLSGELTDLVAQEATYKKNLAEKKKQKKLLMEKILELSDEINSKGLEESIETLEKSKEEFTVVVEEIDEIYKVLEEFPGKIEEVNLALLEETVQIAYQDLVDGQKNLDGIHEEIAKLRDRLAILREDKEELDTKLSYLYSFLHTMIGHEEIEKLDIHYFKKNEE